MISLTFFFAKDSNGSARAVEAERLLKKSQEIRSDVFFLGKNFTNKSVKELKKDFGALFAQAFTNLEINEWSEPIESTYVLFSKGSTFFVEE